MIGCAYFVGSKILENYSKPLLTVLWNLGVKSTQFLGNFNDKPKILNRHTQNAEFEQNSNVKSFDSIETIINNK